MLLLLYFLLFFGVVAIVLSSFQCVFDFLSRLNDLYIHLCGHFMFFIFFFVFYFERQYFQISGVFAANNMVFVQGKSFHLQLIRPLI